MGTAALSLSPQKRGRLRIITKVPDFSFLPWAKRVLPEPAPTLSQEHTNRRTIGRAPLPLVRPLLWLQKVDKLGVKAPVYSKGSSWKEQSKGVAQPYPVLVASAPWRDRAPEILGSPSRTWLLFFLGCSLFRFRLPTWQTSMACATSKGFRQIPLLFFFLVCVWGGDSPILLKEIIQ